MKARYPVEEAHAILFPNNTHLDQAVVDAVWIHLGDLIHDIKSREASNLNNQGVDDQIKYIALALGTEACLDAAREIAEEVHGKTPT